MQRQREFSKLSLVESMLRRGSSVVEQPIRNRQVASSTLALGSTFSLNYNNLESSLDSPHLIRCKNAASCEFSLSASSAFTCDSFTDFTYAFIVSPMLL